MRLDAGLSQRRLAAMASIDHGFLSLIERGLREPSLAVLVAIATALGGDVSLRLFPGTGPRLRDPIQARITEALVRILDARWTRAGSPRRANLSPRVDPRRPGGA